METYETDGRFELKKIYHGSLNSMQSGFNLQRSLCVNRDGSAIYMTSSKDDAIANYACPYSPESRAKIHALINADDLKEKSFSFYQERLIQISKPHISECSVELERPFVANDEPLESWREERSLKGPIANFLSNSGLHPTRASSISEVIGSRVAKAETSSDILDILRTAAGDLLDAKEQIKVSTLVPALKDRFDGIVDLGAKDLWFAPNDAVHIVVWDANKVQINNSRTLTAEESLAIKEHNTAEPDPYKNPEPFSMERALASRGKSRESGLDID